MKKKTFFKTESEYKQAFKILSKWGGFSFSNKRKFTSQQKSAISRRAKSLQSAFKTERTLRNREGSDFRKYDFVDTSRNAKALRVAKKIWGTTLVVGKTGFLIPRGKGVTKGRKVVRVWVDKHGNIRRKVRGSKEVYIHIDNEKLVTQELDYLITLVAPYVIPNKQQKERFPNLPWGDQIRHRKNEEFIRFGLLMYGHLGKDMKSLSKLLTDMLRYIIDSVQRGIEGQENGLILQGLIAVRP